MTLCSNVSSKESFQTAKTIDSSVSTVFAYGVLDAANFRVKNTMESLERNLWVKTDVGGFSRYSKDQYRRVLQETPGNPWIIASLLLARWLIAKTASTPELSPALELLKWTAKHALPSGPLAEQRNPYTAEPISATPLLWSHAEFVLAITEYIGKHHELTASQTSEWRQ